MREARAYTSSVRRMPYMSPAWSAAIVVPQPYAWDAWCRRCAMWLARYEYEEPQWRDDEWVQLATYVRTVLAPGLSRNREDDPSSGLPRFGLRRAARMRGAPPSARHVARQGRLQQVGAAIVYCPAVGCEAAHLLNPRPTYGSAPAAGPPWPWLVNPYLNVEYEVDGMDALRMIGARGTLPRIGDLQPGWRRSNIKRNRHGP